MNSVFSFNKYNFFSFLAAGFCPKNLAFARKIMGYPSLGAAALPAPWLVRLWRISMKLDIRRRNNYANYAEAQSTRVF